MCPEDIEGRVPLTTLERAQLAAERAYWRCEHQPESVHNQEHERLLIEHRRIIDTRVRWLEFIHKEAQKHGDWFYQRALLMFDLLDGKWTFILHKSGEPTIMVVPEPDGDTCYVTERIEPIEYKIEGTDPDAVGQAAVELIRQVQLPVQNVPMPMEKEIHDMVHGGADLLCRCKLSYGIAVRDFHRFSPLGPWIPRYKETQLLGHPMSQ